MTPKTNLKSRSLELRRRLIHIFLISAGVVLRILPHWMVFPLFVACDIIGVPGLRRVEAAYQPRVALMQARHPGLCFGEPWSRYFPGSSASVLFGIGAYRECAQLVSDEGLAIRSADMTVLATRALFELGEFKKARDGMWMRASGVELEEEPVLADIKGMLDIIDGDEAAALDSFSRARRGFTHLMRPHQNIAARMSPAYAPNYLDTLCGAPGRLYDLCNFTGQRVTHVGHGDVGVRLFGRALAAQAELSSRPPPKLSPALTALLEDLDISFDELRIIPEEWTTQIGHLGMLDILFRMRELGWWSGKPVMVVRPALVANVAFFRLFERFAKLLVVGGVDPVAEELLSLQRWHGLNFNAFRLPNGDVVPWQEAGALAIEQWEKEGRGHPLRDEYDRLFGTAHHMDGAFQHIREEWGMKPDDWYVCLHTRDASHYSELAGTGQTHRNSPIEAYLDAIRFVTSKGGWVIKLGGPNSPKLPVMDRTIDYAFSDFKSDLLDIHLIRNARAFIGTTSGLTNVAISFGIPSAIVNGITTDSQLWNKTVRFTLKPVRLADGTMLTQSQLTSTPWRWRVFDAAVLGRSGGCPENNTPDEISGTVREVVALANGSSAEFEADYDAEALRSRWKSQFSPPYYYGTSTPGLYYLKKHETELLGSDRTVPEKH
jgi:putative glycosyltransferase (TIGR04372 family)